MQGCIRPSEGPLKRADVRHVELALDPIAELVVVDRLPAREARMPNLTPPDWLSSDLRLDASGDQTSHRIDNPWNRI
jgi:hypothetical protein